jgi:hypothetical protein
MTAQVAIEPWTDEDLALLRASNTPEMTSYLGGSESEQKLLDRHRRYVEGRDMFRVVLLPDRAVVGSTGKVGFELLGEYDFEYPPGHLMRCNDWRLDLNAAR